MSEVGTPPSTAAPGNPNAAAKHSASGVAVLDIIDIVDVLETTIGSGAAIQVVNESIVACRGIKSCRGVRLNIAHSRSNLRTKLNSHRGHTVRWALFDAFMIPPSIYSVIRCGGDLFAWCDFQPGIVELLRDSTEIIRI